MKINKLIFFTAIMISLYDVNISFSEEYIYSVSSPFCASDGKGGLIFSSNYGEPSKFKLYKIRDSENIKYTVYKLSDRDDILACECTVDIKNNVILSYKSYYQGRIVQSYKNIKNICHISYGFCFLLVLDETSDEIINVSKTDYKNYDSLITSNTPSCLDYKYFVKYDDLLYEQCEIDYEGKRKIRKDKDYINHIIKRIK